MPKDYIPGEWKTDNTGQRYREVGPGMIEYEETIYTTSGHMTKRQLEEANEKKKSNAKPPAELKAEQEELETLGDKRICPLSGNGNKCRRECAFRLDGACSVAVIAERIPPLPSEEMTSGKDHCPITRHTCFHDCAWCVHGTCGIKKIAKGSNTNE